jgi:4'-phosphopantetheinyl transferase
MLPGEHVLNTRTLPLEPGTCDVWWARPADAHPSLGMLLDTAEQQRFTALRQPADRDRFLVSSGLMRLALAGYLARPPAEVVISRVCAECGKLHGKPRLAPPSPGSVEFSVSHSGDRVVVAFAQGAPLGVDVERVQPSFPVDSLAPEVLTRSEAEALRRLNDDERISGFFVYWTRKEAVTKAMGRGLVMPLQSFSVSAPREPARITWTEDRELARRISLHDLNPGPGHVASLAIIGDCRRIINRDGSALIARTIELNKSP